MRILALLRAFLVLILFPVLTIILASAAVFLNILFNNRKIDDSIIRTWAQLVCAMCGVRIRVNGEENIPVGGCLYLFNHSSFFDIFVIAASLGSLRFGAKEELFKIPFFGAAMRRVGTLPIARANREQVYKVYEEARVRFSNGEKFALAPEGGRFFGKELAKFKAGPFIFAMSAEAPLVPLVIRGANTVLPKGSFLFNAKKWCSEIEIDILKPTQTTKFKLEDRYILQEKIYNQMNEVWIKNPS